MREELEKTSYYLDSKNLKGIENRRNRSEKMMCKYFEFLK